MDYTDLYTRVEIPKRQPISPEDHPVLLGSCFTDNIGERMLRSGWDACVNPCGVLYNPYSLAQIVAEGLSPEPNPELATYDGRWFSWMMSTKFSSDERAEAERLIKNALQTLHNGLAKSRVLIVTLGTAWIYNLKETGQTVGNCHKVPAEMFDRRRLDTEQITAALYALVHTARALAGTGLRVIFTVSPIRHFKDGAVENTISKTSLILAINKLMDEVENIEYFPAFEIMMDELRDYRFYAADRIHPSETAVDYIWQRFCDTYVTPADRDKMRTAEKAWRRTQHRPIQPTTNPEGEMPK